MKHKSKRIKQLEKNVEALDAQVRLLLEDYNKRTLSDVRDAPVNEPGAPPGSQTKS